jgi:DNA-binding NarL/FixJ family response regulator
LIENSEIRILVVDDQRLFRGSVAALVDAQDDMIVVGEASTGLEGYEMAGRLLPDVVVLDVEMPVMNGIEATKLIRAQYPSVKVLLLTASESDDYAFEGIRNGAHGYLLKNLRPEELYDRIRAVHRGETPISSVIAGKLLSEIKSGTTIRDTTQAVPDQVSITRRELEILQYVAEGFSNKEIAKKLSITEGTVKNHVHNSLEKLHLYNRVEATAYIVRHGLGRNQARG